MDGKCLLQCIPGSPSGWEGGCCHPGIIQPFAHFQHYHVLETQQILNQIHFNDCSKPEVIYSALVMLDTMLECGSGDEKLKRQTA